MLELAAAVAFAVLSRLAAPWLVAAATLELLRRSNGSALVLGLAASMLGVAGAVVIRAQAKARQLRGYVRNERTQAVLAGLGSFLRA